MSQDVHMPGVKALICAVEEERDLDKPVLLAEDIKIWLPSNIPIHQKTMVAANSLYDSKLHLCQGQCGDVLAQLHNKLLTKRFLVLFQNANIVGQHMSTRA